MFKNDTPTIKKLNLADNVKYGLLKYWVSTISLKTQHYYSTRIYPRTIFGVRTIKLKNNKFKDFEIRSLTEREAKRNHIKVVKAFEKGKESVKKLGMGNLYY